MENVRVYNKQRTREWIAILGTDELPIMCMIPQRCKLPIGEKDCYLLDLKKLSSEQKTNLVKHLAKKFNLDKVFVEKNIEKQGVPILIEDCIASSTEVFKYIDDYDDPDDFDEYGGVFNA